MRSRMFMAYSPKICVDALCAKPCRVPRFRPRSPRALGHMTLSGWQREWPRSRPTNSALPLTTAPVFAVAIMVATCRLELGLFRRPAKPAIMIWGAACVSQGPLDAACAAIRRIRRCGKLRYGFVQTDRVFCLCQVMTAEPISFFEGYFQST